MKKQGALAALCMWAVVGCVAPPAMGASRPAGQSMQAATSLAKENIAASPVRGQWWKRPMDV